MMLELQRQYPVSTPIGYGWVTICSKESGLANDIWTVVMEKDGAHCHFRSDQIFALPNGTLDIATTPNTCNTTTTTEVPPFRGNQTTPKRPSGAALSKSKAATTKYPCGPKRAKADRNTSR
jgi:hypothetical protein